MGDESVFKKKKQMNDRFLQFSFTSIKTIQTLVSNYKHKPN